MEMQNYNFANQDRGFIAGVTKINVRGTSHLFFFTKHLSDLQFNLISGAQRYVLRQNEFGHISFISCVFIDDSDIYHKLWN